MGAGPVPESLHRLLNLPSFAVLSPLFYRVLNLMGFGEHRGGLAPRVVVRRRYKLIAVGEDIELYDLLADPGETKNLAGELPDVVRLLSKELPELAEGTRVLELDTTARDLKQLRAMGYAGEGK